NRRRVRQRLTILGRVGTGATARRGCRHERTDSRNQLATARADQRIDRGSDRLMTNHIDLLQTHLAPSEPTEPDTATVPDVWTYADSAAPKFSEVLAATDAEQRGREWLGYCPNPEHNDRAGNPSMVIKIGSRGQLLLHCRRSDCPDGPELAAMLGIARIDTVDTDGLDEYRQPEPEPVTADDVAARERAREPFVRNVADDTSDARDGLDWLERRFG